MSTEQVFLAIVAALTVLLTGLVNKRGSAEKAAERLIDQMQGQLKGLQEQLDIDRMRYREDIRGLREDIATEHLARVDAEKVAEELRQHYESQIADLRAQLEQATLARNARMERIGELEGELKILRAQVARLEKRDTGDLKA